MKRLAIYDCDGTLADSQANICTAMGLCFAEAGLPAPARQAVLAVVGLSLPEAMARLVADADHDALAARYKHHFQTMRGDGRLEHEPLYEGIAKALAELSDAGWLLGIATGKSDRGLGLLLEAHGIAAHFVTLQTADRHPSKPHPSMIATAMVEAGASPETTVMIGDTLWDMEMARAADVRAIGVAWGYHSAAELFEGGAELVLDDPSEIAPLLLGTATQ